MRLLRDWYRGSVWAPAKISSMPFIRTRRELYRLVPLETYRFEHPLLARTEREVTKEMYVRRLGLLREHRCTTNLQ